MYDPSEPKKRGRKATWPWNTIEVGESFPAPRYAANQVSTYGRLYGKKFRSEKVNDQQVIIYRMPDDWQSTRERIRKDTKEAALTDAFTPRGLQIGESCMYPKTFGGTSIWKLLDVLRSELGMEFEVQDLSFKYVKVTRMKDVDWEKEAQKAQAQKDQERKDRLRNADGFNERPWLSLDVGESFETRYSKALEEKDLYERQARRSDNPKIWNLAFSVEILQKHPPHYKFTRTQ